MRDLGTKSIDNLREKPWIYNRYVDDIFCIRHKDNMNTMFDTFNKLRKHIELTMEKDKNNFLAF